MKKTLFSLMMLVPMFCMADMGSCCEIKWNVVSKEKHEQLSQQKVEDVDVTVLYSACPADCDCNNEDDSDEDNTREG